MKLYAIRDRLLDFYMQPFLGPDDKPVLAALSNQISQEDNTDAISKAPHQFEVWKLADINEEAHVIPNKQLIATCDSLIRRNFREEPQSRTSTNARAEKPSGMHPDRARQNAHAIESDPQNAMAPEEAPTGEVRPRTGQAR